jgi:hypothetical protein
VPPFIEFQTPALCALLQQIRTAKFGIDHAGIVQMPDFLKGYKIDIGESVYRMGIGGLHSSETRVSHYSDDKCVLLDRDVTSYYPNIILGGRLYPKTIGSVFLKVYRSILDRRIDAKNSIGTIGKKIKALESRIADLKNQLAEAQRNESNLPSA